jgi:phosphoribosylaminoimidazole (AIR) synthetase
MVFALGGGASVTSIAYEVYSHAAAVNAASTTQTSVYVTQAASTVVTASTSANTLIKFTGIIRMNAGGTVTPQINFSGTAAGTPTMAANSYIRFTPIGTDTVASVGNVA